MKPSVQEMVESEIAKADERFGPFTSSHEGLGVLVEEMHELTEAIRGNTDVLISKEAVQVAAVAIRLAESMARTETLRRSGCLGGTAKSAAMRCPRCAREGLV